MLILDALRATNEKFAFSAITGAMAAGAATRLIWYCRNTSATRKIAVTSVRLDGMYATTAFAAGQILAELKFARGFTAENGTPGGGALTISGAQGRLRTAQATTGIGVIRVATTASLAAPTWTLDTQPIGQLNFFSSAGYDIATPIIGDILIPNNGILFQSDAGSGEDPVVLDNNEGLGLNMTVPATGVWTLGITMKFAEIDLVI